MRAEAVAFAQTNPMDLRDQDRWLLELDGEKHVKGDCHHNDMCYYIAATRVAIRAGKRAVKRPSSAKTTLKKYVRKVGTRRQGKRRSEFVDQSSVVTVRCSRRKRRVVSGPSRIAQMRSNRSYLPGD